MFPASLFHSLSVRCDPQTHTLYFPLQDADGQTVGFKTLSCQQEHIVENTFPETHCFGMLMNAVAKTSGKDVSAVVVLNVPDLLALSVQKLNSKQQIASWAINPVDRSCKTATVKSSGRPIIVGKIYILKCPSLSRPFRIASNCL